MVDPVTAVGWGMKAAGWVASPIISELFKKCSSYLNFDASEKLLLLEPKVLLLERAMQAVEMNPDRPRLEKLSEDLRTAFYEAEDILDDIEYHCLEKKIQDDKFRSDGSAPRRKRDWVKKKVKSTLPGSLLKNKETGTSKKELKDSLEKIEDIINKTCTFLKQLNLSSVSSCNGTQAVATMSRGAATTSAPPPVVIGRDKDRDKIIAMLHEKEGDGQPNTNNGLCYSVSGIHGIGGSGKSTLAQLVCAHEKNTKQEKRRRHFDLVMWVHISQSFSVGAIFKEIFEAATGNSCPQLDNLDTLQNKLEEKLHRKRFLLVLDDAWCNIRDVRQQEDLRQILSPLKAGEVGSKILVTSRTQDALLVMGATKSTCIPISDLDDDVFLNLLMHYAFEGAIIDDHVRRKLKVIGADIAKKLKGSPLAARIVGGRLGRRPNAEFWATVKNGKLLDDTMGALWWSYQQLDQQARRCFAYCSIFPRRHRLYRDELVKLWLAEGFVRCTDEGEEMEDVCRQYFDELVSTSFLQHGGNDYYLVHDLLHDLAESVAGRYCFRIENQVSRIKEGLRDKDWTGDVPRDVRHLFVQNYNEALIVDKILGLANLRTLIIYNVGWGTVVEEKSVDGSVVSQMCCDPIVVEDKVIESIFKKLRKLRVLAIAQNSQELITKDDMFLVPESISQLKHLRYLAFPINFPCRVILPSTLTRLYHIQLLDFGKCKTLEFSSASLMNLPHLVCLSSDVQFPNIGRLISLQTLASFTVRNEQGYDLKQLRDLNKLRGTLKIRDLENVESKEEALEANLAAKERLTELSLKWVGDTRCSPEVEADVFEGLCPPMGLEKLYIYGYKGSRYPNWMVGKQNGGPKDLEVLWFTGCSQLGNAPELDAFTHLREHWLVNCSWDTLPGNIEYLTSLKRLVIFGCLNIRSLPTLPQSLEIFTLIDCDAEFMASCQTVGHPNWQKIQHIPKKEVNGRRL